MRIHVSAADRYPLRFVDVVELFRHPTVASLAARLSGDARSMARSEAAKSSPDEGRARLEKRRALRGAARGVDAGGTEA